MKAVKMQNNFTRASWMLFCIWTLLLGVLFYYSGSFIKQNIREIALFQARSNFNKDMAFRHWIAKHGGLYVPITEETPGNPYMANIDVKRATSSDGTALTLMNPAYAIRQLNETFFERHGISSHLSSNDSLRPGNTPDQWEQEALQRFEQGETEVAEFTHIGEKPYLRLIQPLIIKKECLKCHVRQNHKVGDILGVFGVSLAMDSLLVKRQRNLFRLKNLLLLIWFLGSCFILWGGNKLARANRLRDNALKNMETIYQKSSDGILLIQDEKFIDCNESAVDMLGYEDKEDILSCHLADISPGLQPDGHTSREKAKEMMKICLDQGSNRFEWLHQKKNGESFFVEVVLTRIELGSSPVIHVAWRDINASKTSQQKLAEYQDQLEDQLTERTASLLRSNKRFQILIDDMGENFIVFSFNGVSGELTYVSEGVASVMGLNKEDTIGKPWAAVVEWLSEDEEIALFYTQELLEGKADFVQFEAHFIHTDGGERTVRISAHTLHEEGEASIFIGGILEDITQQKRINLQLIETQKRAEAANKQKSLFLSNMSHEIRTPMNALIGLSELALETNLTDKQYDYLKKINSSSRGLLTVLNDILDYSKIEAGKLELSESAFSLSKLIDEVEDLFVDMAELKNLELRINMEADLPPYLRGDSDRLRQVLVNLLGNGLKFTKQGAVGLSVSLVSQTEKMVRLKFSIVDSGIGIPEDKLALLFKAFSQLDATHTRKYGGTGLGLAISRELVEMMGGRLEVASESGVGSTFSFVLDLKSGGDGDIVLQDQQDQQDHQDSQEEDKLMAMQQIDGAHILLVEDNAINRQVATEILSKANLDVEIAVNGIEAVAEYRSAIRENTPFTAILMDIQMPILDGYGATAQIRENEKQQAGVSTPVPVIAMTAHTMAGDQKKCLDAGMDDYISKPVNSSELFITLAKWIGSKVAEEKEMVKSSNSTAEQKNSAKTQLPDNLPGLDVQEGVSRLEGNTELYLRLLKQFREEQSGAAREIKENLHKKELENARVLVHTIKGVAANLGAAVLAQAALDLEEVLDEEKDAAAFLDLFTDRFDEFLVAITELLSGESEQSKPNATTSPVDYQRIVPLLEELTGMLSENNFNATAKWSELKPLFQGKESELVGKIDDAISRFEFDQTIKLLAEVKDKCSGSDSLCVRIVFASIKMVNSTFLRSLWSHYSSYAGGGERRSSAIGTLRSSMDKINCQDCEAPAQRARSLLFILSMLAVNLW